MFKKLKNGIILLSVLVLLILAIWGPERLAVYRDKTMLNKISTEPVEENAAGYRYRLNSNEKIFILSKCLQNEMLPQAESGRMGHENASQLNYDEITGSYAFVINHQGPTDQEINASEIFEVCNREIDELKELGILTKDVKPIQDSSYTAQLYSAIDVLDPRNNVSVWKVSLSTSHENADKSNRVLDVYVDAQTGNIYEFYVRIDAQWDDLDPDRIIEQWSCYLELTDRTPYESDNPLLETTPYFCKYRFSGMEHGSTVVTVGFYEGINELFLKVS